MRKNGGNRGKKVGKREVEETKKRREKKTRKETQGRKS